LAQGTGQGTMGIKSGEMRVERGVKKIRVEVLVLAFELNGNQYTSKTIDCNFINNQTITLKFGIFEKKYNMILERTKNEILVRLPAYVDLTELQNMLDFLQYKEVTAKSKAKQSDVDKLSKIVNKSIWNKVKARRGLK
jgi:hypothetical protein